MTALDLRRKSGIPRSTLRDILNGTSDLRGCKASTIHKLAGALELPMADVMKLHRPMEASVKAEHSDSRIHTVMGYGNYIVDRGIFLRKLRKLGAHRFCVNRMERSLWSFITGTAAITWTGRYFQSILACRLVSLRRRVVL